GAVDGAAVRYLQLLAPAQEVRVLKIEAGVVAAAGPPEGYAGTQGPDILGDHLDVDFAVGVADGHHARVVYVAQQAQGALGFSELAGLVLVAAGEQQPGFHGRSLGADVQPVRQQKKTVVFPRVAFVEYVADIDVDIADDGSLRFQLRVARQVRGARHFDARVLLVSEFRRRSRFGQRRGEGRACQQPVDVAERHPMQGLQRGVVGLAGANAQNPQDVGDENLAVADLAGLGGADDGLHHLIDELILDGDLDAGLRHEIDHIFGAAVQLRVTPLASEALDLGYRHARH